MSRYGRLPDVYYSDITIDNAAAAYSQNDIVGTVRSATVHTIAARGIHIVGAMVRDTNEQAPDLDLHFWSASPTVAADNAAYTFLDADMVAGYFCGRIVVATANYTNISGVCDYVYKTADIKCPLPGSVIYMTAKLKTAGETWSAASSLKVRLHYGLLY